MPRHPIFNDPYDIAASTRVIVSKLSAHERQHHDQKRFSHIRIVTVNTGEQQHMFEVAKQLGKPFLTIEAYARKPLYWIELDTPIEGFPLLQITGPKKIKGTKFIYPTGPQALSYHYMASPVQYTPLECEPLFSKGYTPDTAARTISLGQPS